VCFAIDSRVTVKQAFTQDADVILACGRVLPLIAAYVVLDSFQCSVQGVLRGSGRQVLGAAVALVGFYCVTLPVAYVFAYVCDFGLMGLWGGMCLGYGVISVIYVVAVTRLNWNGAAEYAMLLAQPVVILEPLLVEMKHKSYGATDIDMSCARVAVQSPGLSPESSEEFVGILDNDDDDTLALLPVSSV
jgi:multidrug resistance protein, MATE family